MKFVSFSIREQLDTSVGGLPKKIRLWNALIPRVNILICCPLSKGGSLL